MALTPLPARLLIVHSSLHIGGAEEVTANLCRHLDRRRLDVTVCCLKEKGMIADKIESQGTEVVTFERERSRRPDYFTSLRLNRLIRERGISLMHSHDPHALADTAICRLLNSRVRAVHTFHYGRYPHRERQLRTLESLSWRWVDRLVAVSGSQRAAIRAIYRIPERRICVIGNGVDMNFSDTVPSCLLGYRDEGRRIIASVSTLTEQKGLLDLLQAAATLKRMGLSGFVFVIAGDGPLRPLLEQRRHELGLHDEVEFLGWIEDAANRMMRHVDIFIQPSLWEAMSIALLEAMSAGVAIVATRVGETPDMIESGTSGILVDAGNHQGMADALARLLSDQDLRRKLGDAAAIRCARFYSAQTMTDRYMQVYGELLSEQRRDNPINSRVDA